MHRKAIVVLNKQFKIIKIKTKSRLKNKNPIFF